MQGARLAPSLHGGSEVGGVQKHKNSENSGV